MPYEYQVKKKKPNIAVIKDKKIALCISGHMRNYKNCFYSLQKLFLDQNKCDIFIFTWNKDNHFLQQQNISDISGQDVINTYQPKNIKIEEWVELPVSNKVKQHNTDNRYAPGILGMYYSLYQANLLKQQYEETYNFKYDLVIRYRPDIILSSEFSIPITLNTDSVYVPLYGDFSGINDQLAYGSSHRMNQYSNVYNEIENLLGHGCHLNPEFLMKKNLQKNGIIVSRFNLNYGLLRPNGTVQNNFELQFGRRFR